MRPTRMVVVVVLLAACGKKPAGPGPDIAIVGESTRVRLEDGFPAITPWFDGHAVTLVGARGETLGIQVLHRAPATTRLTLGAGVTIQGFDVEALRVTRPSTALYGGSHGAGTYADGLAPRTEPTTQPAYFEIAIAGDATPGVRTGELAIGERRFPVTLTITPATLPPLPRTVWAYADPREYAWQRAAAGEPRAHASADGDERACIELFRSYGVLLSPDLPLAWWEARKPLLDGFPHIPVVISTDPTIAAGEVRAWIEATRGTGQVPFTIPIDEPRTLAARASVRALATAVRAAGGGPSTFQFAVTAAPHAELGDAIDLYISWAAAHLTGDRHDRWTYNGAPPHAGSMVLDAQSPGTRTWGWIAWRWKIAVWYVWDGVYWHDRHNRRGAALPGRALSASTDPISFDDGEDHGNLDGVLALPSAAGCRPTLRLAALRRGLQDRQLLELASTRDAAATAKIAADLVPRALGDASGAAAWPRDEAAWERARRALLAL